MPPDPTKAKDPSRGKGDDASVGALASEFKDLAIAYAKQETLEPLKSLGNYLKWGLAGTVCMVFGVILLVLAAVRAAQTETGQHLTGSLTWLPYVGGLLVAIVVAVLCLTSILRRTR